MFELRRMEGIRNSSSRHNTPAAPRAATWIFAGIAIALLPLMIWLSSDFGVTWDEKARHRYGEMIWEFLRGLRPRSDFVEDGGQLYGGLFDTLCAAIEKYFHVNRYVLRHAVNATFGWAGILYAGRLTRRLFGTWAGVLAMLLLVLSPRYFADSMNNPKDLPFAAASIVAIYYISTISQTWPYISLSTAVKIVLALAVALNIRAGALLNLGYLGLLVLTCIVRERRFEVKKLADTAGRLAAITAGVLVLGTVFWPWAQAAPFTRPIEALFGFVNFPFVADMSFAGRTIVSNELPWYYAPWWFAITTPPVVLAGLLLSFRFRDRGDLIRKATLWALALLPIVLVIAMHSTLYDGVRHLLFVYPPLAVLAASGWTTWIAMARRPIERGIAVALLVAGVAHVLVFDVRSHPNQAVYFNEIVGGPRGAFARYELDYWGNCMLEAADWGARVARQSGIPVPISGEPSHIVQLDSERYHELYFTPQNRGQHAFDVRLARGPARDVAALAVRPDALYKVQTADGAVLCVVVPGPAFASLAPRLSLHQ